MPDRKSLVSSLWVTSSLMLLASVLVAPIQTSGSIIVSSQTDCARCEIAQPSFECTSILSEAMATDAVLKVNALPTENAQQDKNEEQNENEEQDRDYALDEPRFSFEIPCSFTKLPDRRLIAPRSILSLYPLRC